MSLSDIIIILLVVFLGIVIYKNFPYLFPAIVIAPTDVSTSPPPSTTETTTPTPTPTPDTNTTNTPKTKPIETLPTNTACKPEGPFGTLPTLPIPGGVLLDISNTKSGNMNVQEYVKGRITMSNGIVTATMQPDDGNGDGGDSKEQGKQRNEISVKNKNFVVQSNDSGTWGCYFKLNQNVDWSKGYYHLIQIKYNLSSNPTGAAVQPVFTVSINNNTISARNEDSKYSPIQSVCSAVGRWIPMSVSVNNKKGGKIEYNINGKTGSFTMSDTRPELYFKCGQYRQYPNDIKSSTSSSYKDISFKSI